jgi:hypothetical protein
MWRQIVTKLEGGINSMANSNMNSDEFSKAVHQFSQTSMGLQRSFEKALDGYLKALRLPSQTDIKELRESLQRIEERIELLITENRDSTVDRPLRTRRQSGSPKAADGPAMNASDRGR